MFLLNGADPMASFPWFFAVVIAVLGALVFGFGVAYERAKGELAEARMQRDLWIQTAQSLLGERVEEPTEDEREGP